MFKKSVNTGCFSFMLIRVLKSVNEAFTARVNYLFCANLLIFVTLVQHHASILFLLWAYPSVRDLSVFCPNGISRQ